MIDATNPELSFALDVADKVIKATAVLLGGGVWTYWNYRKSRTYAQKLELQLNGALFEQNGLFLEISAEIRNLGATRHVLQRAGTLCEVVLINQNLAEQPIRVFRVFTREEQIEPGESISDLIPLRIDAELSHTVWIRIDLRVISGSVEWRKSNIVRLSSAQDKVTQ